MDLTPEKLRGVEFREKLRGYHPDDVDDFLEAAAVALEGILVRLRDAEAGARSSSPAPARLEPEPLPAPPPSPPSLSLPPEMPVTGGDAVSDETLRRTLVLAQRTADLAVAEAEDTAREIIEHAQSEAGRIRDEAKAKADALLADAESRHSSLEREIAALQSWAVQHRDRLRDAVNEQIRSLDVWLAASTPPASARPGYGRGIGQRRAIGSASRALKPSEPPAGDVEGAPDTDDLADVEEPAAGLEDAFSTRVFRRR